jgi:hypothetical protein
MVVLARAGRRVVRESQLTRALLATSQPSPYGADVRLLDTDEPVAVTVGALRPTVLLSRGITRSASKKTLQAILAHEREHVARTQQACPLQEYDLELTRVEAREDREDHVLRRRPVWQVENRREPVLVRGTPCGDRLRIVRTTHHRHQADDHDRTQRIPLPLPSPRILKQLQRTLKGHDRRVLCVKSFFRFFVSPRHRHAPDKAGTAPHGSFDHLSTDLSILLPLELDRPELDCPGFLPVAPSSVTV